MSPANGHHKENSTTIHDFRQRLTRIEVAVQPLNSINQTLKTIETRLAEIREVCKDFVNKFFIALKWLGIGTFIIVMFAMGFKEFNQFFGK
jgi:hypothetical protein